MSVPGDVPIDEVAVVYGWMQRLCNSDRAIAEDWTVEVMSRFRRGEGPPWLQSCDRLLRLHYFTAAVVLSHGTWSGPHPPPAPQGSSGVVASGSDVLAESSDDADPETGQLR